MLTPSMMVALVVLLAAVGCSDAVQCYECSSDEKGNCADPFNKDKTTVTKCNGTFCVKSTSFQKRVGIAGEHSVARGCDGSSTDVLEKNECSSFSFRGDSSEICACKGELCNAAQPRVHSAGINALLSASVVLIVLLSKNNNN